MKKNFYTFMINRRATSSQFTTKQKFQCWFLTTFFGKLGTRHQRHQNFI